MPPKGNKPGQPRGNPVSAANQRPNPKNQNKRKGYGDLSAGPNKNAKQARTDMTQDQLKVFNDLSRRREIKTAENDLQDWTGEARGRDNPGGVVQKWIKVKSLSLVISITPTEEDPEPTPFVFTGFKGRYNLASNAPSFTIQKFGYSLDIHSDNVERPLLSDGNVIVSEKHSMQAAVDDLAGIFASRCSTPRLTPEQVQLLLNAHLLDHSSPTEADSTSGSSAQAADPATEQEKQVTGEDTPDTNMKEAPQAETSPPSEGQIGTDDDKDRTDATPVDQESSGDELDPDKEVTADEATLTEKPKNQEGGWKKRRGGIYITSFKVAGNFWFDQEARTRDEQMHHLLWLLNDRAKNVTIVQGAELVKFRTHGYWLSAMNAAILQGTWHFYNGAIGTVNGTLFKAWVEHPDKRLKFQRWMEIKQIKGKQTDLAKYASQHAKKTFGSTREVEVVMSASVIYEAMYENQIAGRVFNFDRNHKAVVLQRTGAYVRFGITINGVRDISNPLTPPESRFILQQVKTAKVDEEITGTDKRPQGQAPLKDYVTHAARRHHERLPSGSEEEDDLQEDAALHGQKFGPLLKGHAVYADSDFDFVLATVLSKENKGLFTPGHTVHLTLQMEMNPIPTRRQLSAIGDVCRKVKPTAGEAEKFRVRSLHNFIRGAGNLQNSPYSAGIKEDMFSRITDTDKARFDAFTSSLEFNEFQKEAWDTIFNNRYFIVQIQGPPGTRKTDAISSIAVGLALLKVRCAVCAPSHVAIEAMLKNIIVQFKRPLEADQQLSKDILIVYLPANAATKLKLKSLGEEEIIDATYRAVFECGSNQANDPLEPYRIDNYIIRSMKEKIALKKKDWETAEVWLSIDGKLKAGHRVDTKMMREFVDASMRETYHILADQRVKMVVSTCSNAALMRDYGYRPDVTVMDETACCTEAESMVPLSLGSRTYLLVGDHEWRMPMPRSRNYNSFAEQLRMSMFNRHYGSPNIPLISI